MPYKKETFQSMPYKFMQQALDYHILSCYFQKAASLGRCAVSEATTAADEFSFEKLVRPRQVFFVSVTCDGNGRVSEMRLLCFGIAIYSYNGLFCCL